MSEYTEVREKIVAAVLESVIDIQSATKRMEIAEKIANMAMDAVLENYRSISDVHSIVQATKAGMKVRIDYADPSEMDEDNPYLCRTCY